MHIKTNPETPVFKCRACGTCCSHIRGFIPEEDKEFLRQNAFGKLPVVQVAPIEQMTFPLWDWEAKRFREWAKGSNVDADIRPLRVVLDLNSNRTIILTYFINSESDACPFLKQGKCSIYHTKRSFVCRLFPFNREPLVSKDARTEGMFGDCKAVDEIAQKMPKEPDEMVRFLHHSFPDGSFVNAVQSDIVVEWSNRTIVGLIKKKSIKPAMNYPYSFLLKRIMNSEKIDFTDFLIESNDLTRDERENLINRFDNNIDAQERIKGFI